MRVLACLLLSGCATQPSFNWAIQGQDGAIAGCPGQYRMTVNIEQHPILVGCWGRK